jgi:hypothetical protein
MLIPTKFEKLERSIFVIGAEVLVILRRRKNDTVENLFQELKKQASVNLEQYFDTLVFLWVAELIKVESGNVSIKR